MWAGLHWFSSPGVVKVIVAPVTSHVVVAKIAPPTVSVPIHISIPSLYISTSVTQLGLQPNGQVAVPANASTVGWYKFGPTPGQLGAAVILGHVDSLKTPGAFLELRNIKKGARIDVRLANGVTTHFRVQKVILYPTVSFPSREVYTSSSSQELNLVTCGGLFNFKTRHYESSLVVYSLFTGSST